MVRVTVLASGSRGNATVITGGRTSVLVDAGVSCRELVKRMQAAGEDPRRLDAILITHEHQDHVQGLSVLARRLGIPVYFTETTHRAWMRWMRPQKRMNYAEWLAERKAEAALKAAETERSGATPEPDAANPLYREAGLRECVEEADALAREINGEAFDLSKHREAESGAIHQDARGFDAAASGAARSQPIAAGATSASALTPGSTGAAAPGSVDTASLRTADSAAHDSRGAGAPTPKSVASSLQRVEAANPRTPAPNAVQPVLPEADPCALPAVEYFQAGKPFAIGDLEIAAFTIPHDAADPVGFCLAAEGVRIGLATDLGYMPANVCEQLRRCDVMMLESNHDLEMLRDGPYPWSVKQRVLSRVGHLSNTAAAEFLEKRYDGQAAYVVLAHLSESNNLPDLARVAAEWALRDRMNLLANKLLIAEQHVPTESICL